MLNIKKFAPVVLAAILLHFTAAPSFAHLTDPPHAIWIAGFQDHGITVGIGEQFQVQAEARFTPADPLPFPEHVFFARQFDFTVPAGFEVTYSYIANGECTVGAPSVHCETRNAVFAESPADILVLVLAPDSTAGSSSLALSTTAVIDGTEYTDNDTFAITILPRRSADIAVIPPAPPAKALPVGTTHTDQYRLVNNGPDAARQVDFEADYRPDPIYLRQVRVLSVTPSANCLVHDEVFVRCHWDVLAPGQPTTVSVTFTTTPREQRVDGFVVANVYARSYETDPDPGNSFLTTQVATFCSYFVEPTSTVDPKAKVATSGCTYVGDNSVIGAKATIGKGAYVSGAGVGAQASIGQGSVFGTFGVRSTMGAKSSIGSFSYIQGEIGESATIGDRVTGPLGLVVEANASLGSGTSFEFSQPGTSGVRILAGAKIPANTVVTEQYCLSNPKACTVTG